VRSRKIAKNRRERATRRIGLPGVGLNAIGERFGIDPLVT